MNKKKMFKGLVVIVLLLIVFRAEGMLAYAGINDSVQPAISNLSEEAKPNSATLVWVFKEENGIKYRRLYDTTNGEWLTDWIPCN